ncbi:YebC/PmpR family DNA-binding transcriptional regulator [Mycoplasmopsis cynos]|uniref:Probable transcriptional regulatory protein MCYN_0675 n=2 Tax=Mycoplasmopsis cynos TaxID=171284 RepID=L0RW83_MYCC1|nr:YebC/PmpR family DNA-binding transcriptional regulator [Mycoplasmopsis cynos]WQQ13225.1 YebC/PmpR family DNA-binding transcriptional regulator [Mycoplasmopsis cynos]WQQ13884.1 YebC/PmpR family DNA-binding transcriptional regulator [Mycoplasmopsis cynos]WQQ14763.1 YebC/PmpR family DNA-binding transcriptional regulator [Mycoplasmopsis cynos]WQQ15738.1 YebC/PmpR family DNA-binding transcriptional regulator [Mycoplasmopsis cynos]WQQ16033.1 YebC/PmpR family DNA-binding transcriptional regulator 
MAGHSHSANIAHRKGAQDAARGKIFQKLSKEIFVAASSGPDPDMNPALKLAIAKAKSKNMPKDNIERAIAKAKGSKNSDTYTELTFNATVSGGATFIVVTLSDNVNRVKSNIQSYFNKQNATLGKTGQIPFAFDKKGIIEISKELVSEEDLMMIALENNVENIENETESFVILCAPEDFSTLKNAIETKLKIDNFIQCEVTYIPNMYVEYDEEKEKKLLDFVEKLKDDDDVQDVYHNIEIKTI